jgi:DNA-directed RNA polymerase delta subunit
MNIDEFLKRSFSEGEVIEVNALELQRYFKEIERLKKDIVELKKSKPATYKLQLGGFYESRN